MRLSTITILTGTFVAAAAGSLVAAGFAVNKIEDVTEIGVRQKLDDADLDWAEVRADGLQVELLGTAPTEAARFRAKTLAGTVVDASRVIDEMQAEARTKMAPPAFSIEILRNGDEISLIGLIPAGMDRDGLVQRVSGLRGVRTVSDLLQTADYPTPQGWRDTIDYGLRALNNLPNSKISLSPSEITVVAMSQSPEDRRKLEAQLRRDLKPGLALDLEISAPRPIIAPFTLRFVIDEDGARFDACSADTEAARDRIIDAANDAGLEAPARCVIALGVPSSDWGEAASQAIRAVGELGGGSASFSDADVTLIALEGTDQALFDRVVGELDNALPDVYALHATLPKTPDAPEEQGPPEFVATLSPEGQVQLRGRVSDDLMRKATESLAKARFGSEHVYTAARLDDQLPETWPLRVLTALDALSRLSNGVVTVTPEQIAISGNTGDQQASAAIARLLGDRLGQGEEYKINVAYQEALDPIASIPTASECLAQLQGIQSEQKIGFEPGSTTVDSGSRKLLDNIAEVLKQCQNMPLEVAGYTDSQGREEMNQSLSQQRAQAVVNELRMRRVLTSTFLAKGYGEEDPIADNGTEEGREANRRIEFRLIAAEGPVVPEGVELVTETTDTAEDEIVEELDAEGEGSGDADFDALHEDIPAGAGDEGSGDE